MSAVDELVRAREAYDRRDWLTAYNELSAVDPAEMDPAHFSTLAMVAYLVGRQNDCVQALQQAYRSHLDGGDPREAVRCAFWLARVLIMNGEAAVASGWTARAQRVLDDEPEDTVEHGYLLVLDMHRQIFSGELGKAVETASGVEQYGRRFEEPDLVAMGLAAQGRLLLYSGRVPEGLELLDEAMTELAAGDLSTVFAGEIYCLMIEACQEISDLGRAEEWTAALVNWCDSQTGLVAYTGQCAVHRGQIMALHGAYDEALRELERAVQRYVEAGTEVAAGLSFSERGDVLRIRGELDAAEAAYEDAGAHGHDPQPGLALLWLERGRVEAALGAARRLSAEQADPVRRSRLLPGLVEIYLAAESVEEAGAASAELTRIAADFGCAALRAVAGFAAGGVALARDDAAGAVPELRRAARVWNDLDAPYERARCRARLGRALRELGDEQSARTELDSARRAFAEIGAAPVLRDMVGPGSSAPPGGLSPREVEVLALVAAGNSNQQIAQELTISQKTVARHLSNIFNKLDVRSRTAAAAFAFEHDLL